MRVVLELGLAAINMLQVVLLAWIASRGARRRRSDKMVRRLP